MREKRAILCITLGISVAGIIIIGIPVLVNSVLGAPAPKNLHIVGTEQNWLSFWGAYLGGLLAAGFGFVSLFITDRRNKRQLIKQSKQKMVDGLRSDLLQRAEALNFYYLEAVVSYYKEIENSGDIIRELQAKKGTAQSMYYSWKSTSFFQEWSNKPPEFDDIYKNCTDTFCKDIDSICILLKPSNIYGDEGPVQEDLSELLDSIKEHIVSDLGKLYNVTREWLEHV